MTWVCYMIEERRIWAHYAINPETFIFVFKRVAYPHQEIRDGCSTEPPQSSAILGRWIVSLDAFSLVGSRSGEGWAVGSGINTAGMNSFTPSMPPRDGANLAAASSLACSCSRLPPSHAGGSHQPRRRWQRPRRRAADQRRQRWRPWRLCNEPWTSFLFVFKGVAYLCSSGVRARAMMITWVELVCLWAIEEPVGIKLDPPSCL